MKNGRSCGPDGIPTEALKQLGDWGVRQLTNIFNAIMQSGKKPDERRESIITPIYKDKGDHMNCSNYRGIKLLSHTMKLWERIIDQRLRDIVSISDGQFGFKPGVGTTDAIFVIRTLCEKYREGNKPLDMVFVDLEKAYDTVPREVLWRCMRKRNIPEGYIRLVQDMYQGATTRVKSKRGISEQFEVGIGLHQGSALSPFLFIMLVDTISQDVRNELPWELLDADDLAIIDITSTDTQNRLDSWQKVLTHNGLKINVAKTEHLSTRENPLPMKVNGDQLKNVDHFKYLGSVIDRDGTIDRDVDLRVRAAWSSWRKLTGVLYDRKIPLRLKAKVYEAIIRPALTYGSECWAMKVTNKRKIATTEMRMLRGILGVSRRDHMRNEEIRRILHISPIDEVMRCGRLRWFGHVQRRDADNVTRRVMNLAIPGTRRRGRPKKTWNQQLKDDMTAVGVTEDMALDRTEWRRRTRPTPTR